MKRRIDELKEFYKEDELAVELLCDLVDQSKDYVNAVIEMENQITMLRLKLDDYDYRLAVQNLDRNRRLIHNGLIVTVKAVNRMLSSDDLEPLYKGDVNDRYQIADFAGNLINCIFVNRVL